MDKQPIIQLSHIHAAYDRKLVLDDVNLTVYEKDFLGVIGPNGGGKTTLIKIILGLIHPVSGEIRFYKEGKVVPEISMGYLPQYNSIDKKFPISVYDVVLSLILHATMDWNRLALKKEEKNLHLLICNH